MRIIHIHRILGIVAVLATVGSFLIELRGMLPTLTGTGPEAPGSSSAACDGTIYEPAVRKLRAQSKPVDVDRFAMLGADPYFTYYYDYATGRVACVAQQKPRGPLVEASRSEAPDPTRRNVILVCVLVMVTCGTGLQVIRLIRSARERSTAANRAAAVPACM